jgi:hypothetical protein
MNPENDIEDIIKKVIKDKKLLNKLLQEILSKKDEIRTRNYKILLKISKTHPSIMYSKWYFLVDLLDSDNHFHRYIAINLIANIISVDIDNKFNEIFDIYFGNIEGNRTMVAGQTVLNSGKIAKEIPNLRLKIINILLNIDKIHQGKQTELLKGYAIEAFNDFFDEILDKKDILIFVKTQLNSNSPRTKKIAKEFLEKWSI